MNRGRIHVFFSTTEMGSSSSTKVFPPGPDPAQWLDRRALWSRLFDTRNSEFSLTYLIERPTSPPPHGWVSPDEAKTWWQTFGKSHIAVQIGNVVVHWTRNSVTLITELFDRKPVAWIKSDSMVENTPTAQARIIDTIIEWNATVEWGPERSSLDFARAIFSAVHRDMGNRGAIWRFLKHAAVVQDLHPTLFRSKKRELYPNGWKTHLELDQWCLDGLPNTRPQLQADETALLKSFHDAYSLHLENGLGWNTRSATGRSICTNEPITSTCKKRPGGEEAHHRAFQCVQDSGIVRWHEPTYSERNRVLVIEDDNIRCIEFLWRLHDMEVHVQRYCWELFDVISGSGSGAIIAMAMACMHMSARSLLEYFYARSQDATNGPCVFADLRAYWNWNLASKLQSLSFHPRLMAFGSDGVTYSNAPDAAPFTVEQLIVACTGKEAFPAPRAFDCLPPSAIECMKRQLCGDPFVVFFGSTMAEQKKREFYIPFPGNRKRARNDALDLMPDKYDTVARRIMDEVKEALSK